jgi:hypothetical protein
MSLLDTLQKAEKSYLIELNDNLRTRLAKCAAEKFTAVRRLALARKRLQIMRGHWRKKLEEMENMKAKMRE